MIVFADDSVMGVEVVVGRGHSIIIIAAAVEGSGGGRRRDIEREIDG